MSICTNHLSIKLIVWWTIYEHPHVKL